MQYRAIDESGLVKEAIFWAKKDPKDTPRSRLLPGRDRNVTGAQVMDRMRNAGSAQVLDGQFASDVLSQFADVFTAARDKESYEDSGFVRLIGDAAKSTTKEDMQKAQKDYRAARYNLSDMKEAENRAKYDPARAKAMARLYGFKYRKPSYWVFGGGTKAMENMANAVHRSKAHKINWEGTAAMRKATGGVWVPLTNKFGTDKLDLQSTQMVNAIAMTNGAPLAQWRLGGNGHWWTKDYGAAGKESRKEFKALDKVLDENSGMYYRKGSFVNNSLEGMKARIDKLRSSGNVAQANRLQGVMDTMAKGMADADAMDASALGKALGFNMAMGADTAIKKKMEELQRQGIGWTELAARDPYTAGILARLSDRQKNANRVLKGRTAAAAHIAGNILTLDPTGIGDVVSPPLLSHADKYYGYGHQYGRNMVDRAAGFGQAAVAVGAILAAGGAATTAVAGKAATKGVMKYAPKAVGKVLQSKPAQQFIRFSATELKDLPGMAAAAAKYPGVVNKASKGLFAAQLAPGVAMAFQNPADPAVRREQSNVLSGVSSAYDQALRNKQMQDVRNSVKPEDVEANWQTMGNEAITNAMAATPEQADMYLETHVPERFRADMAMDHITKMLKGPMGVPLPAGAAIRWNQKHNPAALQSVLSVLPYALQGNGKGGSVDPELLNTVVGSLDEGNLRQLLAGVMDKMPKGAGVGGNMLSALTPENREKLTQAGISAVTDTLKAGDPTTAIRNVAGLGKLLPSSGNPAQSRALVESMMSLVRSGQVDPGKLVENAAANGRMGDLYKVVSSLEMSGGKSSLTPEQAAELDQLKAGMQSRAVSEMLKNPKKWHQFGQIAFYKMGMEKTGDFVGSNPWSFWAGLAGLVLGGGALASGALGGGNQGDDAPAPNVSGIQYA